MARKHDEDRDAMSHVRPVFLLYLLVIVAGLALYVVVGLTHH